MRPVATLISTVVMALGAIGLAVAAPGTGRQSLPEVQFESASGALSIANSRAGQAVFSAGAMRPGEGVSGTVQIGNDGELPGRFNVRASGVNDIAGPDGGLLSERVELVLFDVTRVQNPITVYAGTPADFDSVDLGVFAPGASRSYLFAATLPDGDPQSDNLYQGSALGLGFEWQATAVASATPTPTPTSVPTGPAQDAPVPVPTPVPPVATPAPSLGDILGLPSADTCIKKGKLTFRLKAPAGTRVVSATLKANGRTKARFKGSKANRKITLGGLGKKTAKVAISVKASNGKTYSAARTYKPCR
jgi:hypothetical protein